MIQKAAKVVAINLLLIVVCLVVLDLVFGDWLSRGNLGPVRVPRDVVVKLDVGRLYSRDKEAVYSRDEFGLRGPYEDVSKIDILTLGGSTTDQLYIDDDDTWQAVMRRKFAADGNPLSIVNAGVQGQSTIGNIANFDYWFPQIEGLKARYMLLYVGINEIFVESHAWDDAIVKGSTGARLQQMYRNNSIYAWGYKLVKGMLRAKDIGLIHPSVNLDKDYEWTDKPMHGDHRRKFVKRLEQYQQRLRILIGLIRGVGSIPILATHPRGDIRYVDGKMWGVVDGITDNADIYPVNNGIDRQIVLDMFNQVTLEVCHSTEGAICIPMAEELRFERDDFYDWGHTTPEGAMRIGEYLFEALKPHMAAAPTSGSRGEGG